MLVSKYGEVVQCGSGKSHWPFRGWIEATGCCGTAYPLPGIDDSLRLLDNQQWFSTMDLASGYWKVAMSPEAKRKAEFATKRVCSSFV